MCIVYSHRDLGGFCFCSWLTEAVSLHHRVTATGNSIP